VRGAQGGEGGGAEARHPPTTDRLTMELNDGGRMPSRLLWLAIKRWMRGVFTAMHAGTVPFRAL
jgi:hypothetical protein